MLEHGDESSRLLELGEVTDAVKDLQMAARESLVRCFSVRGGNDRVICAPDDQQGQRVGEIETIAGGHPLPSGVDHRAQGGKERSSTLGLRQRGVATRHLGQVGVRVQANDGEAPTQDRPRPLSEPGGGGDEEVGTGQRRGAQDQADLGSKATAGDQHEALDDLGKLVGELHRDAAAE